MAPPKPFHVIDGKRWIRISRAASLMGTSAAKIREMMGGGQLDWQQLRSGSTTFLVDEEAVLLHCQAGRTELKAAAKRAKSNLPTARQRRTSQLDVPPESALRSSDIFVRTWDPSPGPGGFSGRQNKKRRLCSLQIRARP